MNLFEAAIRALRQTLSPALRGVLWRSIGLATGLLLIGAVALHRSMVWFVDRGADWLLTLSGGGYAGPIGVAEGVVAVLAGLGLFIAFVFLVPPVTALVASLFADDVAETVERRDYPHHPPGRALPVWVAVWEAAKFFGVVLLVNLAALPTLLIAGIGVVVFFLANTYLLGREYFEMVAMRFRSPEEAQALRRAHAGRVFLAGLPIAALVSVPILSLITPIFATVYMVHVHKIISAERGET
ncbi:sulfate transporter family protein [Blastochloris tepida]|uniref:Cysteine biosynthesis protein n=1 Tax=Blastochloris tepida TaxID=2233851 RepID=A0A348G3J5_9HYPH|nr:sulfate transporter family protein [Blastochloris tepida]BBF94128.1 cysteine biosynthesis protein [Blastochloris tepida]